MNLFVHTIRLRIPLQGQDIAEIIDLACGSEYVTAVRNEVYREGRSAYQLGQTSQYPDKQFLVTPQGEGEEGLFKHDVRYEGIVVTDHSWPGPVYAVGYDNADVINEGVAFVQAIEKALRGES